MLYFAGTELNNQIARAVFINTFSAKRRIFMSKKGSRLSLIVTNPPSFGDFSKIKKQLTKLGP